MPEQDRQPPISGATARVTWSLLLAKWTQFAQSALALPPGAQGARWGRSIAPIIGLQSITCALGELHTLDPAERALGLDLAAVMLRRFEGELSSAWAGLGLPARVREIIDEARQALAAAQAATAPPGSTH